MQGGIPPAVCNHVQNAEVDLEPRVGLAVVARLGAFGRRGLSVAPGAVNEVIVCGALSWSTLKSPAVKSRT